MSLIATYPSRGGESLVNIEQNNRVLDGTVLQWGVNTGSFSHFEGFSQLSLNKGFVKDKNCGQPGGKYTERGPFWPQAVSEGGSLALGPEAEKATWSHSFLEKGLLDLMSHSNYWSN